jgi:hypothetical protein
VDAANQRDDEPVRRRSRHRGRHGRPVSHPF